MSEKNEPPRLAHSRIREKRAPLIMCLIVQGATWFYRLGSLIQPEFACNTDSMNVTVASVPGILGVLLF